MNNELIYIVDQRCKYAETLTSDCYLSKSFDKVKAWMIENKDYSERDIHWWWCVCTFILDNEFSGELYKIFDWDGNELEEQPINHKI